MGQSRPRGKPIVQTVGAMRAGKPTEYRCHACGAVILRDSFGLFCPNYEAHPQEERREEVA